jgi:hypothetical protein
MRLFPFQTANEEERNRLPTAGGARQLIALIAEEREKRSSRWTVMSFTGDVALNRTLNYESKFFIILLFKHFISRSQSSSST